MKQLGIIIMNSGFQWKSINTYGVLSKQRRYLSQIVNPNGIRVCLVDTLALVCFLVVRNQIRVCATL
ncbi:putative Coiled-coil domain-containing protein [Helianthus annuus]|nr:putative Coiled-coil domain-containing protein [Helianthus annuus]